MGSAKNRTPPVTIHESVTGIIKTAESGAQTSIFCAVDAAVKEHNGLYYSECRQRETKAQVIRDLWHVNVTPFS